MSGYRADPAEFLTSVVRERIILLRLVDKGAYDAAVESGDALVRSIVSHLQDTGADSAGALPHRLQLAALTADLLLARVAAGRHEDLPVVLDQAAAELTALRHNTSQGSYAGGAVCRHGRPSMDGDCLKRPPCSD